MLPSNYHLPKKQYVGAIHIGGEGFYTDWYDDPAEAELELRCLEKQLSYEMIKTVADEGYFPERAIIMEELYQASGRTNGLYTGLNMVD